MTETEQIIYLEALLKREQEEKQIIIGTLKKALSVVGLYPMPQDERVAKKIAIKTISSLASQMLINSKAVEEKFSFLKELVPIVEKYKDEPQ